MPHTPPHTHSKPSMHKGTEERKWHRKGKAPASLAYPRTGLEGRGLKPTLDL